MKIRDLVGDLSYKEIEERRWRIPKIWRNGNKLLFFNYIISYDGIIIRRTEGGNWQSYIGRKMKNYKDKAGYLNISLRCNGIRYMIKVHRLMHETWKEKIPFGKEINHMDGVKDHNDLDENLKTVTPKGNQQHAIQIGLHWTKKHRKEVSERFSGERNPRAKLTEEKVLEIRKLKKKGWSFLDLARKFKVGKSCIYHIVRRYSWTYI